MMNVHANAKSIVRAKKIILEILAHTFVSRYLKIAFDTSGLLAEEL